MWYLKDGDLSQIADGIEITDEQAQRVIDAKQLGKIVSYENNELIFTEPVKEEIIDDKEHEITPEELQAINELSQNSLIAEATQKISILQDAIDMYDELEIESPVEDIKEQLKSWKKYRILLSMLDISTDIEWPTKPN